VNKPAETILHTQNLGKSYGMLHAVDDVSLSVESGTIHAVIGPNGAGKTTLFQCLTGGVRPTSGRVYFTGKNVTGMPAHNRVSIGMGRSFQLTSLFQELSAQENLRIAAQGRDGMRALAFWHGVERHQHHIDLANEILTRLGLESRAHLAAGELSHGQQRILEVGMALAAQPRMLFLDEPTSGMGVDDIPVMTKLIAELGRDHTILLIEHNMSIVMSISNKITVMHQGGILVEGSPEEVRADERVRSAYLGEAT